MRLSVILGVFGIGASLVGVVLGEPIASPIQNIDSVIIPLGAHTARDTSRLDRRQNNTGQPPNHEYYFDQRLDHFNPTQSTFKQRYFFSDEYWGGEGYPIIFTTSGQNAADTLWQHFTGNSIIRTLMAEFKAAGVILEHRYYGSSSPHDILSSENLKYLTLDQSMEDIRYFLHKVRLPWAASAYVESSNPHSVPWIHIGCGYSGLLAAYIQQDYPSLFAASWASSAPVQADLNFWEYYSPLEDGMPKNCSSDAGEAISYIDSVIESGDTTNITAMKTKFGMQDVENDDFVASIVRVFWTWTTMQPYSFNYFGYDMFYRFCDALETRPDGSINQLEQGIGLPQAYDNYAAFFKQWYTDPFCPGGACYSSYNYSSSTYKDWGVRNYLGRQWSWLTCNEFGWFQTGDPSDLSNIVSKYVTVDYYLRICSQMFPRGNNTIVDYNPDVDGNNRRHRGWNLKAPRLLAVDGEFDPWRSASLCSKFGPDNRSYQDFQTVILIKGGHHCWDWSSSASDNTEVKGAVDAGIMRVRSWLGLWYDRHPDVDKPETYF